MKRGFVILTVLFLFLFPQVSSGRMYIDITSPGFRAIPTAIYDLLGPEEAEEISAILRDDLEFSGVFYPVDRDAYIETPLPVFNPQNWTPLGVELVLKGSATVDADRIEVIVYLYDVVEARKILQRRYSAHKRHLIPLAHSIADDIYKTVTGEEGGFRTKIAFIGEKKGKRTIYLMDWNGRRLKSTGITAELLVSLHWSRDGKKLLYSSARGKQWGIYLADFQKRKELIIIRSTATNIAGDFFPDGERFLFSSSKAGTPDLYIYNMKKKKAERITWKRGIEISPTVSPDGRFIAFVSDHGGTPQIYVMGLDGKRPRRISFNSRYCTSPAWSPRGDRIAYTCMIGGKHQIFIVGTDGSDSVQLTDRGNNEDPSFSPNGRFITFTSDRDGYKRVYIMRANGEVQRPVSPKNMRAFGPEWSPNKVF